MELRQARVEDLAGGSLGCRAANQRNLSAGRHRRHSGQGGVRASIAIRGFGTLRERRWATFDDLTFLPCSLTRIPLEGYREKCSTKTVLGTRFAKKPIELDIPVMITGMSWGALSYNAKVALAKGARDGRLLEHHRRRRHAARPSARTAAR